MRNNTRRKYVNNYSPEIDLVDDDFSDNMHAFLGSLERLGRSDYTIVYYRTELSKFMRTLEERSFKTGLRTITRVLIEDEYIKYLREERRLKHASITSALRALRAFFNWSVREGIIEESPMTNVVIGEAKAPRIETFSREQIRNILSQPDPKLFVGLRDITIMTLFLETGIRVRELCDLRVEDIRFEDNQILANGKNGEERLVPIQTQTRRMLKRYLQARGHSYVDNLFISIDDTEMNRETVRRRIAKYGRMANIKNIRCSPHTFRHTFAKMSVQNGADLFTLQAILGHKTLDMVRRYVNMFGNDVKDAHARFSPVENLNIRF